MQRSVYSLLKKRMMVRMISCYGYAHAFIHISDRSHVRQLGVAPPIELNVLRQVHRVVEVRVEREHVERRVLDGRRVRVGIRTRLGKVLVQQRNVRVRRRTARVGVAAPQQRGGAERLGARLVSVTTQKTRGKKLDKTQEMSEWRM